MPNLQQIRAGKRRPYPDQAIYAEFAARSFGLEFKALDAGSGLAFGILSPTRELFFGGGRCSYFPQNNAAAATLAADKYLSAVVMDEAGLPTLGGRYFFLGERHRALRPDGHEREDAVAYFHALDGHAFVKPLTGSRGDFAQSVHDKIALRNYIDDVARHYDSIIMQPIAEGDEYRIFVRDDVVLYSTRKHPPFVLGDGASTFRKLLDAHDIAIVARGISSAAAAGDLDAVPAAGARWPLPGRMNRSAGGQMTFADPPEGAAELAIKAVRALGLRIGGVDLFMHSGDAPTMRVIEVNANPSIRFLEDSGRDDLILAIWRHAFVAVGLLDV